MRLSTKGRYAVTAMMDIALHERIGPVTLADISQCQGSEDSITQGMEQDVTIGVGLHSGCILYLNTTQC